MLNPQIKATLIYSAMIFTGLIIAILTPFNPEFSFDSILSDIPFLTGLVMSILGLHELCHVIYCHIKGVKIIGTHFKVLKSMGIIVAENHSPEANLSSLISIPITVLISIVFPLPVWVLFFIIMVVCFACISDIKYFLSTYKKLHEAS